MLGPLLFLIYINDIVNVVESQIRLFADDTSLFIVVEDPAQAAELLNKDLDSISKWSKDWLVDFNPSKTECLLITRKKTRVVHPPLVFNDTAVSEVKQHKHLCLTFNYNLSWNVHISDLVEQSSRTLNILKSLKYKLSRNALEKIYKSFIRPKLEYADVVWDCCTEGDAKLIENVQLTAARNVTGAIKPPCFV